MANPFSLKRLKDPAIWSSFLGAVGVLLGLNLWIYGLIPFLSMALPLILVTSTLYLAGLIYHYRKHKRDPTRGQELLFILEILLLGIALSFVIASALGLSMGLNLGFGALSLQLDPIVLGVSITTLLLLGIVAIAVWRGAEKPEKVAPLLPPSAPDSSQNSNASTSDSSQKILAAQTLDPKNAQANYIEAQLKKFVGDKFSEISLKEKKREEDLAIEQKSSEPTLTLEGLKKQMLEAKGNPMLEVLQQGKTLISEAKSLAYDNQLSLPRYAAGRALLSWAARENRFDSAPKSLSEIEKATRKKTPQTYYPDDEEANIIRQEAAFALATSYAKNPPTNFYAAIEFLEVAAAHGSTKAIALLTNTNTSSKFESVVIPECTLPLSSNAHDINSPNYWQARVQAKGLYLPQDRQEDVVDPFETWSRQHQEKWLAQFIDSALEKSKPEEKISAPSTPMKTPTIEAILQELKFRENSYLFEAIRSHAEKMIAEDTTPLQNISVAKYLLQHLKKVYREGQHREFTCGVRKSEFSKRLTNALSAACKKELIALATAAATFEHPEKQKAFRKFFSDEIPSDFHSKDLDSLCKGLRSEEGFASRNQHFKSPAAATQIENWMQENLPQKKKEKKENEERSRTPQQLS